MYTLDGSNPQQTERGSTLRYEMGASIMLTASTTVKAIHVVNGISSSIASHEFMRARVPTPVARYGGNLKFYPSMPCTLSVAETKYPATIRYTLDNTEPGPSSQDYRGTPVTISKSLVLRAYATASGYDESAPLRLSFVMEAAATPSIEPPSGNFPTTTLTVRIKSTTPSSYIRYTTDPSLPQDKWNLMYGDSVSLKAGNDGDTIKLQAQAIVPAHQTSLVQTARYVYLPPAAAPVITPGPKTFYDTLWVRMTTTTPEAVVRYTDDNSIPTSNSADGSKPILLTKPATLKARAFKDKRDPSAVTSASYSMRLSQPTTDTPEGDFTGDSLVIHLGKVNPDALIFYSLDGYPPVLDSEGNVSHGTQAGKTGEVVIGGDPGVHVVKAIAVAEGISSDIATFTYTKKEAITNYSAPIIEPQSREFFDTLSIRMSAGEPGAEIRYTLTAAGRDPTESDPVAISGQTIRIDSTVVLRCRAFARSGASPRLNPSEVRAAKYTLRPSQPVAYPMPGVAVPAGTVVTLKTRTKGGIIHYATEAGVDPTALPGYPDSIRIVLNASSSIYAATSLGSGADRSTSSLLTLRYEVYTAPPSDTLAVNEARTLSGGFGYLNRSPQAVLAKVHTADGMGLTGFSNVSLVMTLRALATGQALEVAFTKTAGSRVSLYRFADGRVEFVTEKNAFTLTQPGDYFAAVDIQPPAISVVKQEPKPGDSTTVRLKVADNVAGPACIVYSPGVKGGMAALKPDAAGIAEVKLKGNGGEPAALWLRAVSRDAYDSTRLPADPAGKIYVSQLWAQVSTPNVLRIGQGSGAELWDLAGLPLARGTSLTWAQLREANPGLEACVWRDTGYVGLGDSDEITQNASLWIGSRARHSGIKVPNLRAGESEADGTFRIRLKPGWNHIASPSLEPVYWPVAPEPVPSGPLPVKAPYKYTRTPRLWTRTDLLEPWIGYLVNYNGESDTVITVYSNPAARPAAKAGAEAAPAGAFGLTLSLGEALPVNLQARTWARDGIGPEDEPQLPAWGKHASIWSQRGTGRLISDLIRYREGEVARWQVIADPGPAGGSPALSITRGNWPAGYEAWAVSRVRGLKFPLRSETSLALPENGPDTLSIFAGPKEALAAIGEWSGTPERVDGFAYAIEKSHGQSGVRLEMPWSGKAEISVRTLAGRRVAEIKTGSLAPGIYRLGLFSGNRPGVLILRLRVESPAGTREFSRAFLP